MSNKLINSFDELGRDFTRGVSMPEFSKQCAVIAEEFAIGFAEWNSYKYKYLPNKGWFNGSYQLEMGIFKSSEELLEIYKKEKGL